MNNFSIAMGLMDFVPVIFFGITAVLLLRDLYNKMGKSAYALLAAGSVNVFLAGFCKIAGQQTEPIQERTCQEKAGGRQARQTGREDDCPGDREGACKEG